MVALLDSLRKVAERHLADVSRLINSYLTVKDNLEPVPAKELLRRAQDGLVIVLDVRPAEEYASGHLPGAINIPFAELEKHLNELNSDHEIVAYCRGPHCILVFDAVEKLREKGFVVYRLEGGFPEWKVKGFPIEGTT